MIEHVKPETGSTLLGNVINNLDSAYNADSWVIIKV